MTPRQKELDKIRKKRYRDKKPEYGREAAKRYYHANKEVAAEKAKAWRLANKEYVLVKQREDKRKRKLEAIDYLGNRCWSCNEQFHPAIFEFHHLDPSTKDRDPSKMLSLSWVRLSAELDKCALLCANCHRLVHHKDKY
jgi:hypothetical protein